MFYRNNVIEFFYQNTLHLNLSILPLFKNVYMFSLYMSRNAKDSAYLRGHQKASYTSKRKPFIYLDVVFVYLLLLALLLNFEAIT